MKIAFTGHRPAKLGGYSIPAKRRLLDVAIQYLTSMSNSHPDITVYTGMALGWDQAVAHACMLLRIPFIACIPFKGQESAWPESSQKDFNWLLQYTKEVVIVSEGGYSAHKMQVRNIYMVDNADILTALWDGTPGGTANCVRYAVSKNKEIVNLYQEWIKL